MFYCILFHFYTKHMSTVFILYLGLVVVLQTTYSLDFAGGRSFGGIDGGVEVLDHCDPNDPNSCGSGKCCVRESMGYIPEFQGPKPAYRIRCQPLGQDGHYCFTYNTTEACPCMSGFACKATLGSFGHCHRK